MFSFVGMKVRVCIDRELQVIRSKTVPLGIRVRENTPLKHLIIRVINSRNNKTRVERQLFILGKEVVDVLVQHHTPNGLQRYDVLGPGHGAIERVKVKPIFMIRVNHLEIQLPFREVTSLDRIVKILSGVTVIRASDFDCFVVHQTFDSTCGLPCELHIVNFSFFVN
ncbi:hypothetical protein Hanom_Chr08g00697501 [Helianthus anomalus]